MRCTCRCGHPLLTPALSERAWPRARSHRGGFANLVLPTAIGAATFFDPVDDERLLRASIETVRETRAGKASPFSPTLVSVRSATRAAV